MAGKATLTIVTSMPTSSRLRQQIPRTRFDRTGGVECSLMFGSQVEGKLNFSIALIYEGVLNFCKCEAKESSAGEGWSAACEVYRSGGAVDWRARV